MGITKSNNVTKEIKPIRFPEVWKGAERANNVLNNSELDDISSLKLRSKEVMVLEIK